MPGALSNGFKFIAVSALTIAISLGRVEMANAYFQPSDTSQIANDGGKEKGDKGKEKSNEHSNTQTKGSEKKSEDKSSSGTSGGSDNSGSNGTTNNGNNGTVKIINDQGDATDDQDEDSHVCLFHIFGFNFDANQSGTWDIVIMPPGGGPLIATQSHGTWAAGSN